MIHKNITAIILAGGNSLRFGTDKLFVKLRGTSLIEILINRLKSLFENVIIIANQTEKFAGLGVNVFTDNFTNIGPLAGIHSGLINSNTNNNFVIACDLPLIVTKIIRFIVDYPSNKEIKIVSFQNDIQPLCGMYSKSLESKISELVKFQSELNGKKNRNFKTMQFVLKQNPEIIKLDNTQLNFHFNPLFNVNTKADFDRIQQLLITSNDPEAV
jgi:molybdenum cofactor guanylyltransferase